MSANLQCRRKHVLVCHIEALIMGFLLKGSIRIAIRGVMGG